MTINQMKEATKNTLVRMMQEAVRQTRDENPHNVIKAYTLVSDIARDLNYRGMAWDEIERLQLEAFQ